jgi:CubicO group peptidase (beta-lactamase class C family)
MKAIRRAMPVSALLGLLCLVALPAPGLGGTPESRKVASGDNARAQESRNTPSGGHARAIAAALSGWLPEQLKERGVPGAAVAVVDRDGAVWEKAWGVTDGPGSSSITLDTLFNIRSISKSVTALGVLMAVQDGLVDLDTPISEYLPEFTVRSSFDEHPEQLMTLRLMLAHRAGFTHDPPAGLGTASLDAAGAGSTDSSTTGFGTAESDWDHRELFREYIETLPDSWLRSPVGYRHYYANRGYDLAGYIIQVRSGRSFPDYMKHEVLDPIGMTNSSFDLDIIEQRKDRAVGHDTDGEVVPVPLPEIAAAGLYSSVRDMSRYLQFHLNNGVVDGRRLLREDLMAELHAIQLPSPGQRTGYTLGLWREVSSDTISLYHAGGGRGFGSHMIVYPELETGAVLLTNREYHGLTEFEGRTIMNGPIINRGGPIPIADPGTDRSRRIAMDDPLVNALLGRYGDSPGVVIEFENGVLGIRMNESTFLPLTIYEMGGDVIGLYGAASEFHVLPPLGDQPGSLMMVNRIFSNHNSHYAEFNDSPTDPPGPAKAEWQAYVGEYDVIWEDEPASVVEITIRNGYLYYRDGKAKELQPGLFMHYNGEVLDFRTTPSTYATQEIRRRPAS